MRNWKKIIAVVMTAAFCCMLFAMPAAAAEGLTNGATDAINSLNSIIADLVAGVGAMIVLVGIVLLAASIPGHDSTQRVTGGLTLACGLIIAFAPSIVRLIGVNI